MELSGGGAPKAPQFQPARAAVLDIFNLYLGRVPKSKGDDSYRETPNKMQKRITANRALPPSNEQFLLDFEQLQAQFSDKDQLRAATESVLTTLVLHSSGHAPHAEFLLFAVRSLCSIDFINWNKFLPALLSSISVSEVPIVQGTQSVTDVLSSVSGASCITASSITISSSNLHPSNSTSTLPPIHAIASPGQGSHDPLAGIGHLPVKPSEVSYPSQPTTLKSSSLVKGIGLNWIRQLSCKIILQGIEHTLKPVTYADIFSHMMNWLVNWEQQQYGGVEEFDGTNTFKSEKVPSDWIRSCLDVIWLLIDEDKCRVPFYELLRSDLQFLDNIPDDEALFTMILEIHRRRDMVAMHMQMLDQHLHCPSFATNRNLSHFYPIISGESMINLRAAPLTYPSVLGEPLHGEDLATMIQKDSIGWERALRCLRHALRATPSPDWWRRVLVIAPCYRQQAQQQIAVTGVVFSAEMVSEAIVDRIMELLKCSNSEGSFWLEWLTFSDILYFLTKNGYIDFLDFVDKLVLRVRQGDQKFVHSNHITWLLTQIIRLEVVTNALNTDPKKVEAINKIISFQCEERNSDQSIVTPQSILLEFISTSQSLRIRSFNNPSYKDSLNHEQIQKGKQIEEWWRPFGKGERMLDFANLDDRSLGMFWVLSHTMVQSVCDVLMSWLNPAGVSELIQPGSIQPNERMMVMRESCPLPMTFLSGLSIHLLLNLTLKIEDTLFQGQVIPSISLVEIYARILLIAPHSLFRLHFSTLSQRYPTLFSKPGASLLLLEILNYRLIPLYRYNGRSRSLLYDVSKTIASMKGKRGEHRSFRLAENLCMNIILSLRDYFSVKRDLKEPSELTETLNRICIVSLAIMSKTRGIGEIDNFLYLQPLLEQILATSQHTWSDKTLRHFPPMIREFLKIRVDKRGQVIQAWQQAEATVINQCTQLLSPQADPTYVMTYINHSFPQHRKYLCAGAWMLMNGHPDNINSANLSRVLRELSPDEVTSNIYTMVDVLLHHIQIELQHGHLIQDLLFKASANLSFFIWTHELLPLDIVLLALADRDDDPHALRLLVSLLLDRQEFQQRVKIFGMNKGPAEHWLNTGLAKRVELQKALGNHLSGKDRYPPFFDDVAARMLPVIPLIVYRLIENDAADAADKLLATYSGLLIYHPLRFTFVREILAYFYGHLPSKLIVRILHVLDLHKVPFSESFPQHINSSNPPACPPSDYFSALLMGLVNNVMPPLSSKPRTGLVGDTAASPARTALNKAQSSIHSMPINMPENQKAFYQIQDPGTYSQLMLETAVIEILSLPVTATQIVSAFVQIVVHVQPVLVLSSYGVQMMQNIVGQGTGLPTSPSGGSTDSMSTSRSNTTSGNTTSSFASRTGCTSQSLSCLMIQACGLLLAQLPQDFHLQLYVEASRIIKECWWLTDAAKSSRELDSAVGYALWDPTWAAQDNTSTEIGNTVALLHAFFSNLPQEWLEGTQTVIKQLRPVNSVAMLRIAFRIMGPLLPRVASTRSLFLKTLALLFNVMADVFGRNSQPTSLIEVKDISDIIDFVHHAVLYEGQGPVQGDSKPKLETLTLCGKMVELLRPDVQHLFSHLRPDPKISIYAATHPKLLQSTS